MCRVSAVGSAWKGIGNVQQPCGFIGDFNHCLRAQRDRGVGYGPDVAWVLVHARFSEKPKPNHAQRHLRFTTENVEATTIVEQNPAARQAGHPRRLPLPPNSIVEKFLRKARTDALTELGGRGASGRCEHACASCASCESFFCGSVAAAAIMWAPSTCWASLSFF